MGVGKEKVSKDYEKKKRKGEENMGGVYVCGGKVTPRDKDWCEIAHAIDITSGFKKLVLP